MQQQRAHPLVFRAVREVAQGVSTLFLQQLVEAPLQHQMLQVFGVVSFRGFHVTMRYRRAVGAVSVGLGLNSGMRSASFFTV
jgi:hypothetical protein